MKKDETFENAMKRLEEIVALLEAGKLPLDESLSAFEEGVSLVKQCNDQLQAAEQRVRILMENGDGEISLQDFSADTDR